jgi:O-antigen/teichoic acid export membrane protein
MGIVIRQTLKGSWYSYIGVALGGINVALLFPIIFAEDKIGLINVLLTVSAIGAQFSSLGAVGIINYFFPKYNNKASGHKGFLWAVLLFCAIGFLVYTLVYLFLGDTFLNSKEADDTLRKSYGYLLYPLTFFTLVFNIIDAYAAATLNAVIGFLYKEVVLRLFITVLCLLVMFNAIDFSVFMVAYVLNMAIPSVAILYWLAKKGEVTRQKPLWQHYKPYIKQMGSVGFFYILTGLSTMLATYTDKLMINYFIGLKPTGVYSIANYIGSLVGIPRNSMGKIATPLLAKAVNDRDHDQLSTYFHKSSISQVLIGIFIFLMIWVNVDTGFRFLPESYADGKWVVFFIAIAYVVTCFLGLGSLIIQVSHHYRYASFFIVILGVATVFFNYLFIPAFGINGAAAGTALAKLVFVASYLVFLAKKMHFQVLYFDHFKIVMSGVVAYFVAVGIPLEGLSANRWVQAAIELSVHSGLAVAVFVLLLFATRFIKNIQSVKNLI